MALTAGPDLTSRGFVLNNPLNIAYRPQDKWQGRDEANPCDNPPGGMTKLVRFLDPVYGIRAGARQIIKYQDDYECESVADHITRWAPPPKKAPKDKNHTKEYIRFVAEALDVLPDDPINVHEYETLRPMIEAMIDFENKGSGHPYTDTQIDKALVLAGVEPPKRPLSKTGTMRGLKIAGSGLGLASLAQEAQDIAEPVTGAVSSIRALLASLKPMAPYLFWAAVALVAVGLIYIGIRRYEDRRLGLR